MATISEIRDAISDALNTIDGLRATGLITDQINPPQAIVYRKPWTYDEVQHGPAEDAARTYLFGVTVYAGRAAEHASQNLLDGLAEPFGDLSVKQTVETDAALSALCDWAIVTDVDEVKVATFEATSYLAQDFTIQVGVSP